MRLLCLECRGVPSWRRAVAGPRQQHAVAGALIAIPERSVFCKHRPRPGTVRVLSVAGRRLSTTPVDRGSPGWSVDRGGVLIWPAVTVVPVLEHHGRESETLAGSTIRDAARHSRALFSRCSVARSFLLSILGLRRR